MSDRPTYRQYIGARYVPKFFENSATGDSTWASGTEYEPLTIVTWNQNCYTSKKIVPSTVTAPNLNPEYWVLTGNYNAYVGLINERLDGIDQDISDTNDRIDTTNDTIDEIEDDISDIQEELATGKKRKFILIGDSYSTGYTSDEGEVGGWIASFINTFGLIEGSDVFLHDRFREGLTGTPGFSTALGTRQFTTQLQWIHDNVIPAGTKITDIIVLGGTNDLGQDEINIATGIETFCTVANSYWKNVNIKIGCLLGYNGPGAYSWHNQFKKVVRVYSSAEKFGSHYILNSEYICADKSLYGNRDDHSDYYHPDRAGYAVINKYTNQLYNGDSVNVVRTESVEPFITPSTGVSGYPARCNITFKNDMVRVESFATPGSPYVGFTLETPISVNYYFKEFDIDIGVVNSNLFCCCGTSAINNVKTNIIGSDLAGNHCPGIGFYYFLDDGHVHLAGLLFREEGLSTISINHILADQFAGEYDSINYAY